jgi:2-aminobenzoate-CoA ligase
MRQEVVPAGYLPAPDEMPARMSLVPGPDYPRQLNVAAELLDESRGFGPRPAYHYDGGTVTYGELARMVDRTGNVLRNLGIRPGERVLLRLPDGPGLVSWILALQKVGAVPVPVFPLAKAPDLVYRENDTEAAAVVTGAELRDEVDKARPEFRYVRHLIAVPAAPDPAYLDADQLLAGAPDRLDAEPTDRDDMALIIYTSGSTGEPKGCVHTHADILSGADAYARICLRLTPDDVLAGPPPIPFALGFGFFCVYPLRYGASAVLSADKSPARMLDLIDRHGITVLAGVATYFSMLNEQFTSGERTRPKSLRLILSGGEPLPDRIARETKENFGLELVQFLGVSEMLHNLVSFLPGEPLRPGSFGHAVPGYEAAVRDPETFAELAAGEEGILTIRGATGTKYWRKPGLQREAVRDGWCVIKDIVRADGDGFLYYISRSDDMIVSSGFNIAPAYVEAVLLRHPAVQNVACVGAPDPAGRRPTVVKACIVLRPGHEPSDALAQEIQAFFKANAQPNMYPRLIEFLPDLPRTMTGKVRRAALRDPQATRVESQP